MQRPESQPQRHLDEATRRVDNRLAKIVLDSQKPGRRGSKHPPIAVVGVGAPSRKRAHDFKNIDRKEGCAKAYPSYRPCLTAPALTTGFLGISAVLLIFVPIARWAARRIFITGLFATRGALPVR